MKGKRKRVALKKLLRKMLKLELSTSARRVGTKVVAAKVFV